MIGVPTIYKPVIDDDGNITGIEITKIPLNRNPKSNGSESSLEWLYFTGHELGRELQTTRSLEGEAKIGPEGYTVDGYDPVSGQVYEFLGCRYHFCPVCNAEDVAKLERSEPIDPRLLERLEKDVSKDKYLRTQTGLPVVYMTGCKWAEIKKSSPRVRKEAARLKKEHDNLDRPKYLHLKKAAEILTEEQFAERVCDKVTSGELFGFVMASISVPDDKKQFFSEFQPLVSTSP